MPYALGNDPGVLGTSNDQVGVNGISNSGPGVRGQSFQGPGVRGDSAGSYGVLGRSGGGNGVAGTSSATGTTAVFGEHTGQPGIANSGVGVRGKVHTREGFGVIGQGVNGEGLGDTFEGTGVAGFSETGTGVVGVGGGRKMDPSGFTFGDGYGVWARGWLGGTALRADASPGAPVEPGAAGEFVGRVDVYSGALTVHNGDKTFKIDHPLEPQNKYLLHNAVEAPERKNVYDGVAELDEDGTASVDLPEWFEALNEDFRYQLTAVGGAAPNLHVGEEIYENNRFRIAGGEGGMKVCWQVTGTRKDRWAAANPFEVEQEKREEEQGRYLEPSLYGAPEEQRVMRARGEPTGFEPPQAPETPPQAPELPPSFDVVRLQEQMDELSRQIEEQRRGRVEEEIDELRRQIKKLRRRRKR
jgi:hypothetical protein